MDISHDITVIEGHAIPQPDPPTVEAIQILIVDDDEADRLRIRRLARDLGMSIQCEEASNFAALRRHLDARKFDVVLLDYLLGTHDGLDAIRVIRNHRLNAQTPVVMIAGGDDMEAAILSLKSGADDYLAKGRLDAEMLAQAVMEVLERETRVKDIAANQDKRQVAGAILAEVAKHCLERMRPALVNILLQVRSASGSVGRESADQQAARLRDLEENCGMLWTYFEEFEKFRRSNSQV